MRQFLHLLPFVALATAAPLSRAAPISARAADFVFEGDAPYSVDADTLESAITCPTLQPDADSHTVLLVHGTGSTGVESWGAGYVPALLSEGFTPCYVDLPSRAMNDMQVSSEYVAYAMHYLSAKSGRNKIQVISHSQGGPDTQWALRFWPSTRRVVKSFVALSPDFSGVGPKALLYQLCTNKVTNGIMLYLCSAGLWQQAIGSDYYKALNVKKRTFVPTTTIYTEADMTVPPAEINAHLPGAAFASYAVQSICPKSETTHTGMLTDPSAYLLALNALKTDGVADMGTVKKVMPKTTCDVSVAPGMDANLVTNLGSTLGDLALGILLSGAKTAGEPPLKEYALPENQ